MPRYTIQTPAGSFDVDSPTELTDAQAYAAATSKAPAAPNRPDGVVSDSEPSTYLGGFWKGLKEYGKDLVTDPKTMGMVGAGAAAALVPATGGVSALAIPALGAMAGAGGAIAGRQLRTGTPEDPFDTMRTMGTEGVINGALSAVPGAARYAAPKLAARAERLAAAPFYERHAPAAAAQAIFHNPLLTGAVEAAQQPFVNRGAARVARFIGEDVPDAAASLGRRVFGSAEQAPLVVDRFMANESGAPRPRLSREVPGYSMEPAPAAPAAAPAEDMPMSLQALIENDRYAPNRPGYQRRTWGDVDNVNGDPNAAALPFSDGVERYMPNVSTAGRPGAAPVADDAAAGLRSSDAESLDALDRFMANKSGGVQAGDPDAAALPFETGIDRYAPNTSAGSQAIDPDAAALPFSDGVERYAPNVSGFDDLVQRGAPAPAEPLPTSAQVEVDGLVERYMPNRSGALDSPASPGATPFDNLPEPPMQVLRGHEAFEDAMAREPIAAPERGARAVAGAGNPPELEAPYQGDMFTGAGDDSLGALDRAAAPRRPDLSIDVDDPALQNFEFEGSATPFSDGGTPRLDSMRANSRRVDEVKSALVNLGFSPRQAAEVATAAAQGTNTTDEALRAALSQLSPGRR